MNQGGVWYKAPYKLHRKEPAVHQKGAQLEWRFRSHSALRQLPKASMEAVERDIRRVDKEIKAVGKQITACKDSKTLQILWTEKQQLREEKKQLRDEKKELLPLLRKQEQQLRKQEKQLGEQEMQLACSAAVPDKNVTCFFAALLNMAVPDAGNLLTLGSDVFPLHKESRQLYVRECYPELFKAIYEYKNKKHVVTGTPGIGKSFFFYYMVLQLLHSPSPPPFILWEHLGNPGQMWCYTHETGQVRHSSSRMTFQHEFENRDTWYFADGVQPITTTAVHTVLITPPVYKTSKEMEKEGASVWYMPVWEYDELLDCRSKMYDEVPEATVENLYQCYGGVARYVLQHPLLHPNAKLCKLLEPLVNAIHTCVTTQMPI
ncbi:hypothetical protein VOLCADRAFT_105054 [Volvox carteri f. nagariensis]|uniref:Uncharacterized protein n=1 Tax=Volvox carteri f. nagariensis TaxID=3068 RepID=D8TY27_VOLCA|nr:uncharacterized protein VOLCADRAFT_105054 [Volvox carteri f. nagariensis]EFJ47477.1 hypothetical protein VOLCADRAFT_105054 [Volvox carteri f. nagariensis]|eukprot:XP_002951301.1 hypothetical protein VOLCADRAFT_105054 [Volvox carteri f. nagariensis]